VVIPCDDALSLRALARTNTDYNDTPFKWLNPVGKRARAYSTGKVIIGRLLKNGALMMKTVSPLQPP
jgi:hypothetical protein